MVKSVAKQVMATSAQKACIVIDHLVEALGRDPSSSLRRALILVDIDHNPGTTQSEIMDRLKLHKSAMNREIEWLFNYGCIMMQGNDNDGRAKSLHICGYSKKALDSALDYCGGDHNNLKFFLNNTIKTLRQEKPTLRDAKIVASLFEKKEASKQQVIDTLYGGSPSTDNRAFNKLIEEGLIEE